MSGGSNLDVVRTMVSVFCGRTSGLNVCCLNARSIRPKIHEIRELLLCSGLHAIFITESWLREDIPSALVSIPNFNIFRRDRSGRVGGGVAIYVRSDFRTRVLKQSSSGPLEFICVEVNTGAEKCIMCTVYCPPGCFSVNASMEFCCAISDLVQRYSKVIIGGDFNVNLLREGAQTELFLSTVQSLHLHVVNSQPTYFNTLNPSLLDLFLVSDLSSTLFFNQLSPSILDHDLLFLSFNVVINEYRPVKPISFRDFSRIDTEVLFGECQLLQWDDIFRLTSVDTQVEFFTSIINDLFNRYVPLRCRVVGPGGCPWITAEIRSLIAEREYFYARYRRCRTAASRRLYTSIRNKVNTKVRAAKQSYYCKKFNPNLPAKLLWQNLRNAGVHGGDIPSTDFSPSELNNQFVADHSPIDFNTNDDYQAPLSPVLADSEDSECFSFRCVDGDEVLRAVNSIKSNATGHDQVSPKFLKLILPLIIQPLQHIFNTCLTSSTFPKSWKIANVLPIPKCSSPASPSDFRPISLLCFLSKILEKLMYWQIQEYLCQRNLVSWCQSGFRPRHSCETALLKVTTDIRSFLDQDMMTILLLLDFSKAFDSVSHKKLLIKLSSRFGFSHSAILLIKNFLFDRSQRVTMSSGDFSGLLSLTCGVPQGSILGPLLFSLYINDLPEVTHDVRLHLYADDVQLYLSRPIGLIEDCIERVNCDLHRIYCWAVENSLNLNPNKSQCIAVYPRPIEPSSLPEIRLNGIIIPYVSKVRNLGVYLNCQMKCCDHISANLSKIYGGLRRLWLSASILPQGLRMMLVKSLLLPYFTNGCLVFGTLDSVCSRKLRVAFNDCIRFIYGLRRFDHVSDYSLSLLGCSLDTYLKRRHLVFLYKVLQSSQPPYLREFLLPLRSARGRKFLLPRCRTSALAGSYFVQAIRLWNNLPARVQCAGSLGSFRRLLCDCVF